VGKNAQLIYPPASCNAEKIWDAKNYEVLNWRNDRVRQCKVFRVPSTNTSPNARRREAFMYYCFNPQNNLYHIDTLFNNKENVYYNDQTHQIIATNYAIGVAANFIISYKLVNDNWEYLSTERIPHQNIEKKPKFSGDAILHHRKTCKKIASTIFYGRVFKIYF
jgi:hypothetical protein